MRVRTLEIQIVAGLVALCGAGLAMAAPCYIIIDRNDAVIYRDTAPPFDLSTTNSPERSVLRQRGQHLLIAEFDQCYAVGYISPTTGSTTATVDEIVMRLQPAIATSVGSSSGYVTSSAPGSGGGGYTAAPASAPASAPAPAPASAAPKARY